MERNNKKALLEALRQLPTGNIADAMQALGLGVSHLTGLQPLSPDQPPAAGVAVTVRQVQRTADTMEKALAQHSVVIDEIAGENDIVVIDCGGRLDVSTGGSMLAVRAQYRGIAGYVVNGGLRDIREIRELGFPVYFKGATPLKSAPALQTVGINEPVEIGGVQIRAGDIIVMDDTGVLVIPPADLCAVVEKANQIHQKEEKWVSLLRDGVSFAEARKICNEQFPK